MHCWIQISLTKAEELEAAQKIPKGLGYQYTDDNNQPKLKYHVDACEDFQERMAMLAKFEGKLSMQKPAKDKPLLTFGHDECIYDQFICSNEAWV